MIEQDLNDAINLSSRANSSSNVPIHIAPSSSSSYESGFDNDAHRSPPISHEDDYEMVNIKLY